MNTFLKTLILPSGCVCGNKKIGMKVTLQVVKNGGIITLSLKMGITVAKSDISPTREAVDVPLNASHF